MFQRLLLLLGKLIGLRFAPDNHVAPVLRLERFHRVKGPGYFWVIPFIEQTLAPVNLGLQVGNFTFKEVLSRDNISFDVTLTVLFQFDPTLPPPKVLSQLVRVPPATLQNIVRDYASQGVRRLAAHYEAESLGGSYAVASMERDLTNYLRSQLRILGLMTLPRGGVLIKETIPPEKFKQAMLSAKQHQTTLRVLGSYREIKLIEQAIRAQFLTGLEKHQGNLTLFSGLGGGPLPYLWDPSLLGQRNGS